MSTIVKANSHSRSDYERKWTSHYPDNSSAVEGFITDRSHTAHAKILAVKVHPVQTLVNKPSLYAAAVNLGDSFKKSEISRLEHNIIDLKSVPNIYDKLKDHIISLRKETRHVPKPEKISIENSLKFIRSLQRSHILPENISSSLDGGVIFELQINGVYKLVEFFNDGDIVYLIREEGKRFAYDYDNYSDFIQKFNNNILNAPELHG